MNDTEVTMFDALPRHTLIAHTRSLEAAGIALSLVTRVPFLQISQKVTAGQTGIEFTTIESRMHQPKRSTATFVFWFRQVQSTPKGRAGRSRSSTKFVP